MQPGVSASLKKMSFSFLPDGSDDHENVEAHLLDYSAMITITGLIIVRYTQKSITEFLFLLSKSGKMIVSKQMTCGWKALAMVNIIK